ncbi:MAG: potassium transporter TrkH [Lachnospiraceae bacterium]|nr:potassium transporter TrkH [Lachnospiraceae bacterium]
MWYNIQKFLSEIRVLIRIRIKPVHYIPLSFFLAILAGTALLMLPFSSVPGETTGFLTALFTATTSVCVTGLVVVDTYAHWSIFGQLVILFLIQIGGLGVVSVGAMLMIMTRRKFYLSNRMLLGDSLNVDEKRDLLRFLTRIFKGVIIVETTGALLCMIVFIPLLGATKGIWASIFQSVSAFCNAGMDVVGPDSMISLRSSSLLMITTMLLIILGGIGFVVWFDIIDGVKNAISYRLSFGKMLSRLPEHTKIVLLMTCGLIIFGAAGIMAAEYSNPDTLGMMELPDRIMNSLFQSITFRTAGFASIPQDKLTEISCMTGYVLMFIGGSPVGTAGGIKTMTAFLLIMNAFSYINGKKETVVFHRRVPEELMRKSSAIFFFSIITVFIMTVMLMSRGGITQTDALYEVVSALGTVGLSRGLTPRLDSFGRIIIIVSMYLGRIGPISMAIFFAKGNSDNSLKHADGKFHVG